MPNVAVIDYGMGNVASVLKALEKIGVPAVLTADHDEIRKATHIILPGVGAFGDGIKNLSERGLIELLTSEVVEKKKPFLGICLGMQLLGTKGYEFGEHQGLGWIDGSVIKFDIDPTLRLPHIGWNNITAKPGSKLFENIPDQNFYFVHSFHLVPTDPSCISATCEYGIKFAAAIEHENIMATQFHPEKSQESGLAVLKKFFSYA